MAEEINEGLKIIAERVTTHPEEFFDGASDSDRWWEAKRAMENDKFPWNDAEKVLIANIQKEIFDAKTKAIRDKFTANVMKTLMDEPFPEIVETPKKKQVTKHELDAMKYIDPQRREQLTQALKAYIEAQENE